MAQQSLAHATLAAAAALAQDGQTSHLCNLKFDEKFLVQRIVFLFNSSVQLT